MTEDHLSRPDGTEDSHSGADAHHSRSDGAEALQSGVALAAGLLQN